MHIIRARNPHAALHSGLRYLAEAGVPLQTRNGWAITAPGPVTTIYERPAERVVFWPERAANHPFHFFEGLWMLAGRNDLAYITQFLKRMEDFSDDCKTLQGAYGYRWRHHFGYDQLERVINLLRRQPGSRRAVVTMWDPNTDLHEDESATKDACCNTQLLFRSSLGERDKANRLNMIVFNRSNDIIMGLYGANCVHFSMLHELMAARLGLELGNMTTISSDYHCYQKDYDKFRRGNLASLSPTPNPYAEGEATFPLVTYPETWDRDLALFMEDPATVGCLDPFFNKIAKNAYWAHAAAKKKKFTWALEILDQMPECDWKRAFQEWTLRRKAGWQAKRGVVSGEAAE